MRWCGLPARWPLGASASRRRPAALGRTRPHGAVKPGDVFETRINGLGSVKAVFEADRGRSNAMNRIEELAALLDAAAGAAREIEQSIRGPAGAWRRIRDSEGVDRPPRGARRAARRREDGLHEPRQDGADGSLRRHLGSAHERHAHRGRRQRRWPVSSIRAPSPRSRSS